MTCARRTVNGMAADEEVRRSGRLVADGYNQMAERYRAWTMDSPVRLRFLSELLQRLPPNSRVVELGCGAGEPVTRRLSEVHDVVGFDISTEQIRLARQAAPRARLVAADITDVDLPTASADAVVAFYLLGHLPPQAHQPLLAKAVSWLRPGGLLLMSFPVHAGDGVEEDWLGVPMYFGGVGRDATLAALTDAGLAIERTEVVEEDEDGVAVPFAWVLGTTPS